MALEQIGDALRVKGDKSELFGPVPPNQPANPTVAQAAVTVEDDKQPSDGICEIFHL
jgi:hypothetical protein